MKLNKLIYDIREGLNDLVDDSTISNRYIEYLINIKRSKYLRQSLSRGNTFIDLSVQQTYCDKIVEVSDDMCNLNLDCGKLLRTSKKVPTLLDLNNKSSITNIRSSSRISLPFNFVTKDRISYLNDSIPFKGVYLFLDTDMYIYAYSLEDSFKLIDSIYITGVFNDPIELEDYSSNCSCDSDSTKDKCFDRETSDYPIQSHFIDLIRNEVISTLYDKKRISSDKYNDASDSTIIDSNINFRRDEGQEDA